MISIELVFILVSFGCNSENEKITKLKTQIDNLTEEKIQLTSQLEQANAENEQLKSQISVLQKLPENVIGENLYQLVLPAKGIRDALF